MRRSVQVVLVGFLFVLLFIQLSAAVEPGSWTTAGSMSVARNGAVAVDMKDGRVLIVGGTAPDGSILATAEFLNPDGTFAPAPAMNVGRVGHSALFLDSGAVVVFGGKTSSGATASAELYDPAANAWFPLPNAMNSPRAWHSAVRLTDGNVLLVGGVDDSAAVASIELFDVWTLEFRPAGSLVTARQNPAAAAIADGRVLVVGGTDVNGNTLSSTEIIDTAKGTVVVGPVLTVPRTKASATLLLGGRVLVAGGRYPEAPVNWVADLNSAELLDVSAGTSILIAAPMTVARSGHRAYRLIDNNGILIVGGTNADQDVASAEIFLPWTGQFIATSALASAHVDAAGLSLSGVAVIAGGSNQASVELYGFGTVKTDKNDYAPGEFVTITGAGWMPGELVSISQQQVPTRTGALSYEIPADENGRFSVSDYAPTDADLNTAYLLTAVGSRSQAQVAFTDAKGLTVNKAGTGTGTVTTADGFINCGSTCTHSYGNTATVAPTATPAAGSVFAGWTVAGGAANNTCAGTTSPCSFGMNNNAITLTATFNTVAPTRLVVTSINGGSNPAAGSAFSVVVQAQDASGNPGSVTANTAVVLSRASGSGTLGGTLTGTILLGQNSVTISGVTYSKAESGVSITATRTSGNNLTAGTSAAFTVDAGAASKLLFATQPSASAIAGTAFGTQPVIIVQDANGNTVSSSTASIQLTITTGTGTAGAALTCTANPVNAVAGVATFAGCKIDRAGSGYTITVSSSGLTSAISSAITVGKAISTTAVSSSANPSTYGSGATFTTTVTSTGTPTGTVSFYDAASGATCASLGASAQIGTAQPLTGGSASVSTASLASGAHTILACYAGDANYSASSGTASQTVSKATLTVTAADKSMSYGDAVPGLTYSLTGFVNGETQSVVTGTPALSTTATSTSAAGAYPISVSAGSLAAANYSFSFVNGNLTVGKIQLTVTATDKTKAYGAALPALTYTVAGFVNGDTEAVLTGTPSVATTATAPSPVGVYPITISTGTLASGNYTFNFVNGSLTVSKAQLTVTADSKSMTYGGTTPTYTYSATGFANGDTASVLTGSPNYSVNATGVGTYAITISAGTLTAANYDLAFVDGTLTVGKALLTITADSKAMTYGGTTPTYTFTPTGFVNGETAAVLSGAPDFSATSSTAGTHPITVTLGSLSAANYDFDFVPGTLTVSKALLTITADPKSMTYGGTVPTYSYTATGFANGDTASVLTGTPSYSANTNAVGAQVITISAGSLAAANYDFTFVNGTLTIGKAVLTIAAHPKSMTYGGTQPQLTWQASGFMNGDTEAVLTGVPVINSTATSTSGVGSYPISISAGSLAAENYDLVFADASITVDRAPLVIKAVDAALTYGGPIPSFTVSCSGFVNGDSASVFIAQPTVGTSATAASGVGNYALIPSGAVAANYAISYQQGNLAITKAPLTVTANNASKTSGQANPALTGVITGIKNNDSITASYSTSAITSSPAGTYPITVNAVSDGGTGALANYAVVTNPGTLTVLSNKADLVESGLSYTGTPAAGTTLRITETVTNQGAISAGNSATYLYISNGSTKKYLSTRYLATLASGSSSTGTTTVTLPTGIVGTYTLIACADAGNQVSEGDETNNCVSTAPLTVAGADLVETAVSMVTATPGAGASVQVSDTVTNQDAGVAGTSATSFYLSADGKTKNYSLGSRYLGTIAAGGTSTVTSTVTLPNGVIGKYYLIACADQGNAVPESNETNNCTASAQFTVSGADLVVSAASVLTASPVAGGTIQVSDTTTNQNAGVAASSATYLYVSRNGSSRDYFLGSRYLNALAQNASSTGTSTLTLPTSINGTYYFLACADSGNAVAESDETNNCKASAAFTVAGADFVETAVTVLTASPTVGGTIQISDSTLNQGLGAAGISASYIYLSPNGTTRGNYLGMRSIGVLAANATSTATTTVTLPAGVKGTYSVLICADTTNTVAETDETNNCKASNTFTVQ